MIRCDDFNDYLDSYLDHELKGARLEAFLSHLDQCRSCAARLAERRSFFNSVRAARPEPVAPAQLRERIERVLAGETEDNAFVSSAHPNIGKQRIAGNPFSFLFVLRPWPTLAVTFSLVLIAATWTLWLSSNRQAQADRLVDAAVEAHQQQQAGQFPLQVKTASTPELTQWFAAKVPFQFRLPAYQTVSGQLRSYRLVGGRVIDLQSRPAAYIAYQMHDDLISLVMTPRSNAVALGGETTISGSLTFHSIRRKNLQVVTWSVHGLTYALVSAVTVPAGQSCTVCHSGPGDRDLLRKLHVRTGSNLLIHG